MTVNSNQAPIIYMIILMLSTFHLLKGQSLSKIIYENGYEINNHNSNYGKDYFKRTKFTEKQFEAIKALDPFAYFSELKNYSSPLAQKIYKEDSLMIYQNYLDSMIELRNLLKSKYEILEIKVEAKQLGNFDLQNNCFYNIQTKDLSFGNQEHELKKALEAIEVNKHILFEKEFSSVGNVQQSCKKISPWVYQIKSKISIQDERDALKAEQNGLTILVIFNRFDVEGSVYEPRKVLYLAKEEIIEEFGTYSLIDSLVTLSETSNYQGEENAAKNKDTLNLENVKSASFQPLADSTGIKTNRLCTYPECKGISDSVKMSECMNYTIRKKIVNNYNVPEIAVELGYNDTIVVEFVSNQFGKIEDIQIIEGKYALLNAETIKAVKKLPEMIPAIKDGNAISTRFTIPIPVILMPAEVKD